MSPRVALILVVLLAVLGGGALVYQQQERLRRPDNAGTLGQVLLKDLKAADIATIRVVEPGATLTLQRSEAGWAIAERAGFPADIARVRAFALKLLYNILLNIFFNSPLPISRITSSPSKWTAKQSAALAFIRRPMFTAKTPN